MAGFCVARVCQRQLGFLVRIDFGYKSDWFNAYNSSNMSTYPKSSFYHVRHMLRSSKIVGEPMAAWPSGSQLLAPDVSTGNSKLQKVMYIPVAME